MAGLVGNNAIDLAILAAVVDAGAAFDGALVALFQNDFTPDRTSIRTDFTNATYSGYAQEAITWLVPSLADDGTPEVIGTVGEFRPNAATVGNVIFGGLIVTAADALLLSYREDAPFPMAATTDSYIPTVRLRLSAGGLVASVT